MAFEHSIVVTDAEGSQIALIVETVADGRGLATSERQLKEFMAGMGAPVGLLVTPELLRLYRDEYLSESADSIAEVGEFDVRGVLKSEANTGADPAAFERTVQSWLEGLSSESSLRDLPLGLRRAAQMFLVPAILQGTVRAGQPRASLSV